MSNKKSFSALTRFPLIKRVGYPLGVALVFFCILLSAFFSYHFFIVMVERVTTLRSFTVEQGTTFHLGDYRAVAPFFHLAPSATKELSTANHEKVLVGVQNAQPRTDRFLSLQELLKNNGWNVVPAETKEMGTEPLTRVAAKETHASDVDTLTALLLKKGFIVVRGAPLLKDDKADIVITLGTY